MGLRIANHRAQLNVGDGAFVVTEPADGGADQVYSLLVRVEDVNRHYDHASPRGARIIRSPADHPYGERQYTAEDFAGHRWTFSQSIADFAPEEWGGTPGQIT
ncbi:MAG: glyoxalase [Acidobacteriota bacterium]|nr:glyoxalase [Acidobacteriota bacterium]